jgi:Family of unknown function (DUF6069)
MATSTPRSSLNGTSGSTAPGERRARPFAVVAGGVLGAAVVASAVNVGIAAVAHGLGVSDQVKQLMAGALIFLTVIGVVIGGIGWAIIARRTQRPAALLSWLVPAVLALSLIPDVLLKTTNQSHVTVGAVAALMLAHLVTGAIAVTAYLQVLPVRESKAR